MTFADILHALGSVPGPGNPAPLSPAERREFQTEQQCSIGFAGLPIVVRQFIAHGG